MAASGSEKKAPARAFTKVTTRLYTEDVEALKAQAAAADELDWQPRLRRIVHEGVRAPARRVVR
jgi:predicted DNA binding CopG/RHH family protein